ncbi:protease SohB [Ectothiorhodospira marina]|uniref:Serine protease SohB n=1 Tax=Ectothiorhodospira marina TaxID=1396821 RepID=A0A1H7K9C0_9GAMM|nr:protease SohB [Ectothiorhodospira marina]SEK83144.1 serine protease SohB [Ectothiorhodospira marina]
MEFIYDFALFLAKALTIVVAILVVLGSLASTAANARERGQDSLNVRRLNDRYQHMENTLKRRFAAPRGWAARLKRLRGGDKGKSALAPSPDPDRARVFVLKFHGDIRASHVESLREEVSTVLTQARPDLDHVVVCVESGGGMVPHYGQAASQLVRLRDAGLKVTVCVDRIAASGGYLMAAVAHRIVAAPFAIVGSIGVVAQLPNFHRWLKRRNVDVELLTAGEYKRTLTVLGRNTAEGRAKFQEDLEETHTLFKTFLSRYRPSLDMDQVGTGEHWYGEQARPLGLVDELGTSDDVLMKLAREHDLYEITYKRRQSLGKRMGTAMESITERLLGGRG